MKLISWGGEEQHVLMVHMPSDPEVFISPGKSCFDCETRRGYSTFCTTLPFFTSGITSFSKCEGITVGVLSRPSEAIALRTLIGKGEGGSVLARELADEGHL